MEDSLKKRYIVKLLANIISGTINIFIVAIVPKALGPIQFGYFSYIQQFFTQLLGFLDAGTSIAFFTKLSKDVNRVELIKFYFLYAFTALIIIYMGVFLIDYMGLSYALFPNIPLEYIYYGAIFGFLVWFTTIFIYISDAYAITVSVELIKISHRVLSLMLLLYFINYLSFDLKLYLYFQYISLSTFIIGVSYLFIKREILSYRVLEASLKIRDLIKEFYFFASPLFVVNIFSISFALFDIWLLQSVSGSIETGFYSLAYSISAICFLFTSAMTPIITREFAKEYQKRDLKSMKRLFSKYIPMLYSIASIFGVFLSFQSDNLLYFFTNEKFQGASSALMIMAFYPIHQTYGQLSGSIFYVSEQTRLVRNIGVVTTAIGAILSYLFIYIFELGSIGLAFKMVIIQIVSVNIQLYFNSKFLDLNLFKFILHQILSVLYLGVVGYISTDLISIPSNRVLEFFISGVLYIVIVIATIFIAPKLFGLSRLNMNRLRNRV